MAHVSQTSPCLCLHILINDVGFGFDARGVEKTTTRPTSDLQPLNLWSNNAYAKAHSEQYLHAEEEEEPAVASQTCCLLSRHSSLCFFACACLHLLICVTGESEQLWTQGLAYLFFFFYLVLLKVWRNNTHQVPISAQDVQEFIFIIVFWSDRQSLLKNNCLEQNISHLLNMIIVRL